MAVRFQSPNEQFFDSNGDPLSAGTLTFTVTGTSTPLDTYSDNALTTPNTNPVVLDSAGRAGNVFLGNASYKVVLKNSGGSTIWTADPVLGGPANSLFSTITTKSGNYTLQTTDNGALLEFTATATLTMLASATLGSGFRVGVGNASSGIVTINRAGADTFDTGMTSIKLAPGQSVLIQPDGVSKLYTIGRDGRGKGADIASASTLGLGEDGNFFHVTGTTTITAIEARPTGWEVILEFDGILTLTHNATSLILPSAANITTAAGDIAKFVSESDGGNWRCSGFMRASGLAVINNNLNTQSGATYTVVAGDAEKLVKLTNGGAVAVTLPAISAVATGYRFRLLNAAGGDVTVTRAGADTFDGGGTAVVIQNAGAGRIMEIWTDGANWYTSRRMFVSAAQTITAAGLLTIAHGLGAIPQRVYAVLKNVTAELNYSIGDEVQYWIGVADQVAVGNRGMSVTKDATNLSVRFGSAAVPFAVSNKTTGASAAITIANWNVIFIAEY